MKCIFTPRQPLQVPDGTLVSAFLNPMDSSSALPVNLVEGFSLAQGIIEPGVSSKIHLMPLVTQVTVILQGELEVTMKEPETDLYALRLTVEQAVVSKAGTFLQFYNPGQQICKVLYIVSPAYVFELAPDGTLSYDDSIVLNEDWQQLAAAQWQPQVLLEKNRATLRSQAIKRLASCI